MINNTMVLVSQNDLEEIKITLYNLKQAISKLKKEYEENKLMSSKEVMSYLNISAKTWQSYRDKKIIPYSQCGRKIMVRKSDLDDFVAQRRIQ